MVLVPAQWDAVKQRPYKDHTAMQFPMKLDMSPYCTASALDDGWGSEYEAVGVAIHPGEAATGGHFCFFQKLPEGDWLRRNDDMTDDMREVMVGWYQQAMCGRVYCRVPPARFVIWLLAA